ncbi:hypothetical protein BJG93_35155 [Paraburkholderia sprentiae WSM5005]|uniref:Uncharacterized protein n=1 Tax=Paraburkholderia sprentiae WSM5005 TaxID=754502 RepID=A0A8F4QIV3_9BURK|nr:hypothetical protein [Paraburkholderia sprentiae]QXE07185.1 hypothetical protein BJG93_35155 [Paraburkholderia sprentiae WSM5005]
MRPLPALARRTSIFYSIRQGRIHDDSTLPHRPTAFRTNHAEPPRRAHLHPSTPVSIIDAGGAEKTSHPNKKVIFVWSNACWRAVEISAIHVDNGPSGRAVRAFEGATGMREPRRSSDSLIAA